MWGFWNCSKESVGMASGYLIRRDNSFRKFVHATLGIVHIAKVAIGSLLDTRTGPVGPMVHAPDVQGRVSIRLDSPLRDQADLYSSMSALHCGDRRSWNLTSVSGTRAAPLSAARAHVGGLHNQRECCYPSLCSNV